MGKNAGRDVGNVRYGAKQEAKLLGRPGGREVSRYVGRQVATKVDS